MNFVSKNLYSQSMAVFIMRIRSTILHKTCETASPFPSVNVDLCYLGVTACKIELKTFFRITTLTEGGREVTGA